MSDAEVIAAAREIIDTTAKADCDSPEWVSLLSKAGVARLHHAPAIAALLLRLHEAQPTDAAALAELRAENAKLKADRTQCLLELDDLQCELASELGWDLKERTFSESVRWLAERASDRDRLAAENERLRARLEQINTSVAAAHSWMDEAVGDYCKPADADSEVAADCLRLRCESAAKRMTELRASLKLVAEECGKVAIELSEMKADRDRLLAALREMVKNCNGCSGTGRIMRYALMQYTKELCVICKPARDLLAKEAKP